MRVYSPPETSAHKPLRTILPLIRCSRRIAKMCSGGYEKTKTESPWTLYSLIDGC